jgi:hypothetical protein
MRRTIIGAISAMALVVPASAHAQNDVRLSAAQPYTLHGTCLKAEPVRRKVIHKYGKRAPGRDICRFGVVRKHHPHQTRPSTHRQRVAYLRQLRAILTPRPYILTTGVGSPARRPAGTLSPVGTPTGIAACIVARESGGDPQASNGTHFGIAQWSLSTWRAQHGPEMTGVYDPRQASYQQQLAVLNHALATVGSGDWTPYDGCH